MNRADIRNLVMLHTGRTDKASLINSMITAALKKVSSEHIWRDLLTEASVTMIVDGPSVTLASNMRRLSEVRVINGLNSYKLEIRPKAWLVQRWPDFTSLASSKPRMAYLEGLKLFLLPPSDEALIIKYSYYKRITDLTGDNTALEIDIVDEAVIAYATYRTFKSLQQHEDAVAWFADYKESIMNAKAMDRSSAVEHVGTPRGEGGSIKSDYWIDPFVKKVP
ncbi:MAG: hypothetical protein QQN63_02555 [Nitrosopumilus sp.]